MVADAVIQLETTHGPVVGKLCNSVYDDEYYSFERIPYAKPPLGELRFKSPVPIEPWTTPLDCTIKNVKPLQKNKYTSDVEGSEDCLHLNVFTKQLKSDKPMPVLFFIFGGGFQRGDSTTDFLGPDYFMMRDVVLVIVTYRVGPFGFLSLPDPAAGVPGNAGLKDQLLALQWFKKNAANFNGDPNNITVFGESAGSCSTHFLMLNPRAKGLFHKAVLLSGNAFCSGLFYKKENLTLRLAKALGCKEEDNMAVLKFLQNQSADDLVRQNILTPDDYMDDFHYQFPPVIEPYIGDDCVIPKLPEDMMENCWGNSIPLILGGTSFEGLLFYKVVQNMPFLLEKLKDEPQHMLTYDLKQNASLDKAKELGSILREVHFGTKEISLNQTLEFCDYMGLKTFWFPIYRQVCDRLENATAPTYLFRFDFDSPNFNHHRIKYCGNEQRGVAHSDNHSYIWYGTFAWPLSKDSDEYKTILRMIDLLTSFAANSDPNYASIEQKWLPLSKDDDINSLQCYNISTGLKMMTLPELGKLQKWQEVYDAVMKN